MSLEELFDVALLTKVGGSVVAIGSILTYFWKVQPITALTSSSLEKVLVTKETRTTINISRYFLQSWAISMFSTYLVFCFLLLKLNTDAAHTITYVSIVLLILLLVEATTRNFLVRFLSKSENMKKYLSFTLICACFLFVFSVAPGYMSIGLDSLDIKSNNPIALLEIFVLLDLFLLIPPLFLLFLFKDLGRAILKNYKQYNGECFYIEDEDKVTWYIYHSIERKQFLLGDKNNIENATAFKIIEKTVLINKKIIKEKLSE